MKIEEHVELAPYTTLGVGGVARYFISVHKEEDVFSAIAFARERNLPFSVLGRGSNVLVSDSGYAGVVLKMSLSEVMVTTEEDSILLVAGAGVPWDEVVDIASKQGVFGIANLAGIPGSLGGAAVQNIGAYGTEFSETFLYADVFDPSLGAVRRIEKTVAAFAYRTSVFKTQRELVVLRVALRLLRSTKPNGAYADIIRAQESGASLETPEDITKVVRAIRANKFPQCTHEGTAGSFFKNPIISRELADSLAIRYPGLPVFPQQNETAKVSLAWILDHVLQLNGFAQGSVRLYEKQPIVLVAQTGATAHDIDTFVQEITKRVFDATNISIEREVETFGE